MKKQVCNNLWFPFHILWTGCHGDFSSSSSSSQKVADLGQFCIQSHSSHYELEKSKKKKRSWILLQEPNKRMNERANILNVFFYYKHLFLMILTHFCCLHGIWGVKLHESYQHTPVHFRRPYTRSRKYKYKGVQQDCCTFR